MKKIFSNLLGFDKEESVAETEINRERLIRFSHRLRESRNEVTVQDYSVKDEENKERSRAATT